MNDRDKLKRFAAAMRDVSYSAKRAATGFDNVARVAREWTADLDTLVRAHRSRTTNTTERDEP